MSVLEVEGEIPNDKPSQNKHSLFNDTISMITSPSLSLYILFGLFIMDVLLSLIILKRVPYTEIDWKAYMQQVAIYLGGERNYYNIHGDTGPLVYPAGFLYIYSLLYKLTDNGNNIYISQCIFTFIYLLTTLIVCIIVYKIRIVPNWLLIIIFISKRIHSIYILRCFNDCVSMLFLYISILLFIYNHWTYGSIIYSISVSIKMNTLLYAPGIFILYIYRYKGYILPIIRHTFECICVQVILSLPFISIYPYEYIHKSFELGRVFIYKWSVNWKFISEDVFLSKYFAIILLLLHIILILYIYTTIEYPIFKTMLSLRLYDVPYCYHYCLDDIHNIQHSNDNIQHIDDDRDDRDNVHSEKQEKQDIQSSNIEYNMNDLLYTMYDTPIMPYSRDHDVNKNNGNNNIEQSSSSSSSSSSHKQSNIPIFSLDTNLSPQFIITRIVLYNFIGVVCARSLHYQFYIWYGQQLCILLALSRLPIYIIPLLYGMIEYAWNAYPSYYVSSLSLYISHLIILITIIINLHSLSNGIISYMNNISIYINNYNKQYKYNAKQHKYNAHNDDVDNDSHAPKDDDARVPSVLQQQKHQQLLNPPLEAIASSSIKKARTINDKKRKVNKVD